MEDFSSNEDLDITATRKTSNDNLPENRNRYSLSSDEDDPN